MADERKPTSLEELDARVTAAQAAHKRKSGEDRSASGGAPPPSGLGIAVRIGTELVAALAVGVGVGYALDLWLGTKPWLMVAFFFLGSATGVYNVYRVPASMGRRDDGGGT